MYRFAVYDSDSEKTDKILTVIRIVLQELNWKKFTYMRIESLDKKQLWPIQAEDNNMLFISLTMPGAVDFAYEVYQKNPFCKIIFYGESSEDINELLKSRPVAFFSGGSLKELKSLLSRELFAGNLGANAIFFETRNVQVILPIKNIIYFSSQQHYINAVCDKEFLDERFKGKLDDLQAAVNGRIFMRIHKSYLVSLLHVAKLDKKEHLVIMKSGEELPVSDFYYKDVLKKIQEFCPFEP